jgi:hypothetical protein
MRWDGMMTGGSAKVACGSFSATHMSAISGTAPNITTHSPALRAPARMTARAEDAVVMLPNHSSEHSIT